MTQRRVLAVLSPKGGTGKTTVATNVAVGLARRFPGDVALVDLDLAFGDVAAALLLVARRGLEGEPVVHPSGLHVVTAPDEAAPTDLDVADTVGPALDRLTARYPLVVLDTGAGFDPVTRAAVARATDLVLVASMDVPTLLGLRKVLGWLEGLDVTARRHLVLNRCDADVGLDEDDVTATVRHPVSVAIPSHVAVTRSVNDGHPLTEIGGGDPATAAFERLVDLVAPRASRLPLQRRRHARRHRLALRA